LIVIFFIGLYRYSSRTTSISRSNQKSKKSNERGCCADRIHLGVQRGHGSWYRSTNAVSARHHVAGIDRCLKKMPSDPLTRPQTNSVVERDARVASAGRGRPTPDTFCGPARDWPDLVWPKFQFSLKKGKNKGDVRCISLTQYTSHQKKDK
jgi:hypothetical protein